MATVPWDRHGHYNVNNTAYYVSFARRYRLERPRRLQGISISTTGHRHASLPHGLTLF
eukprot:COSAG02_NODE_53295_length_302_cov_1.950739_1_plen_57_part_10